MASERVEAVWMWHFGVAAQKATIARFSTNGFTKDYLQASGECSELIGQLFPFPPGSDELQITYKWPGGDAPGLIKHPNDRSHVRWLTQLGAPAPWKMTPIPTDAGPETLPGDPSSIRNVADAEVERQRYEKRKLDSYLIAVKLCNEDDVLHLRAYIDSPPSNLAFADTSLLPERLRDRLPDPKSRSACSSVLVGNRYMHGGDPAVSAVIERLEENPNLLLTGPPGTGKSVLLDKLARYVETPDTGILFDPDENHKAWSLDNNVEAGIARTVVFHPAYSNDNLMIGLLPEPTENGVAVKASPGPLVNLSQFASTTGRKALLVLDEFNRGNAAAILGESLALLDKDKRGVSFVDLPYADMKVEVPEEFAELNKRNVNPRFTLPSNLWVVAAMNSSDRSVAPLDAALRRRFTIIEMGPDYEVLAQRLNADQGSSLSLPWPQWTPAMVSLLAVEFLRTLNDRIEAVLGSDFQLGHSNFWQVSGADAGEALKSLAGAIDTRITNTLRLAMQDEDEALAVIAGAGESDSAVTDDTTHYAWWKTADPVLKAFAHPRLRFNNLQEMPEEDLLAEVRRLAGV